MKETFLTLATIPVGISAIALHVIGDPRESIRSRTVSAIILIALLPLSVPSFLTLKILDHL